MSPMLTWISELALVTAGYWLIDRGIRQRGAWALLGRAGLSAEAQPAALLGAALGLSAGWGWSAVPAAASVRLLCGVLCAALAWKAATRDLDIVTGAHHRGARLLLVAAAAGVWLSPALVLACLVLLTAPFGLWQHHATLPMRVLQASAAFLVLSALGLIGGPAAWVVFVLVVYTSHYLITALAKALLGPTWTAWVTDNRIHHLAASAYSWGWARFIPWPRWRRFIGLLEKGAVPLQLSAFTIELLAPLALLHPALAVGLGLCWAGFHAGVFATSGLLFWDWIVADLALAGAILLLPAEGTAAFGAAALASGLALLVLFPLRHKLWKPMPLGWWDTPLTQRMHWLAHGESGTVYEVYNDLMCPHERLFGKIHGCFLAPVPVCTYHLGEVYKHDLRDAIRAAGPSLEGLAPVRERFGILPRSDALAQNHRDYLRAFFQALNRGAQKHVLPEGLRWLKAPGGQCFYWGDRPAYRGQEPVRRVSVRFRESYFDGEQIRVLQDVLVEEIEIPDEAPQPVRAPTPREIDEFVLPYAIGRLIDLPGIKKAYLGGDDGAPQPVTQQR